MSAAASGVRFFLRTAVSNSFRQEVVASPVRAKLEELIQTDAKLRAYVEKHGIQNVYIHGTGIGPGSRSPNVQLGEWNNILKNKRFHLMNLTDAGIYHTTMYATNTASSTGRLEPHGESSHIVDNAALLLVLPENPEEIEEVAPGCPTLPAGTRCDAYAIDVSTEAKAAITARSKLFLGVLGGGVVGGALYYQHEQARAKAMEENK